MKKFLFILSLLLFTSALYAQNIKLPTPNKSGGKPLMTVLNERKSSRDFSEKSLPNQQLSNLLWAAWGYNRADKRTAPSSQNKQEMDIYVALASGCYLYDARKNELVLVVKQDLREKTGKQDFVKNAPVNIIFVADKRKMAQQDEQSMLQTAYINTGFISQNIYLYCASEGLATVIRAWVDKAALALAMKLHDQQEIIVCQTVGYPK
ncbi:MAG: SagB/ThcOx family dehydrogenase [Paludibacteraceae bacterium]|nr:SagB/ThcOx family dehydrogenase [Paludibacteraceae bacterium]MBP7219017.1 SagB/ThcOx family dehydrogenase [Paludibacteraceae bacterium]MBP8782113.1 SagB/ThcOx family dehydrogenase [Paludibacteraceae bacterium]NLK91838.1 SagB/ThcOx family dehydrogenase [Bacteroidales bacterium]HPL93928.1 SagB/ThcOx family dehydrogenase [Paludibacteraceae bacterium]